MTVRGPNEQQVRFISTHFQHNVEEDRVAEAHAINRLFADDADNIPTILAGDMNAVPDAEPVTVLQQRWTNAIDDKAAPSAPSSQPRNRIDYIFYRPTDRFRIVETKVVAEPMASDHCPVFAVLELTQ